MTKFRKGMKVIVTGACDNGLKGVLTKRFFPEDKLFTGENEAWYVIFSNKTDAVHYKINLKPISWRERYTK